MMTTLGILTPRGGLLAATMITTMVDKVTIP